MLTSEKSPLSVVSSNNSTPTTVKGFHRTSRSHTGTSVMQTLNGRPSDGHISGVLLQQEGFPSVPPSIIENKGSSVKEPLLSISSSVRSNTCTSSVSNHAAAQTQDTTLTVLDTTAVIGDPVPPSSSLPKKPCFSFNPNARPWQPACAVPVRSAGASAPRILGRVGRGLPASATAHLSSMFGGRGSLGMCMAGGRPSTRLSTNSPSAGNQVDIDSIISPKGSSTSIFPLKSIFSNQSVSTLDNSIKSPIARRVISNVLLNPGSVNEAKYTQEESPEDQLHHFDVSFPDNMPESLSDDEKDDGDQLYGSHGIDTEALMHRKMDVFDSLQVDTDIYCNSPHGSHRDSDVSLEYQHGRRLSVPTRSPCDVAQLSTTSRFLSPDSQCPGDGIGDDMFPFNMHRPIVDISASRILDFLYLGGISDAFDREFLRSANIGTIINISTEGYWKSDLPEGMVVKTFPLSDRSDVPICTIFDEFYEILEGVRKAYFQDEEEDEVLFLSDGKTYDGRDTTSQSIIRSTVDNQRKRQRVLVHCQKGRSRSPTAVASYLMRKNGWNLEDTLDFLKSRRFVVQPNIGFIEQLWKFQTETLTDEERKRNLATQCLLVTDIHQSWSESAIQIEVERILRNLMGEREMSSAINIANAIGNDDLDYGLDSCCVVWKVARECMIPSNRVTKRCNDLEAVIGEIRDIEESEATTEVHNTNNTCSTKFESSIPRSASPPGNDNNDIVKENTTLNQTSCYSILRLAQVCSIVSDQQSQSSPQVPSTLDSYVGFTPMSANCDASVSTGHRNPRKMSLVQHSSSEDTSQSLKEVRPKTSIFFTCAENMVRFRTCPPRLLMRLLEEADIQDRSEPDGTGMAYDTYQKFDYNYDIGSSGEDDDELEMELIDENGSPLFDMVDKQMLDEFTPLELAWLEEQAKVTRGKEADELW